MGKNSHSRSGIIPHCASSRTIKQITHRQAQRHGGASQPALSERTVSPDSWLLFGTVNKLNIVMLRRSRARPPGG